jgi:integrating conjugative element protein (TIGR03761 family)
LRFNHPYGGAAALLLADYDRLMLEALTARHYGLIDRAAFGRLRERAGHAIRRLLASAEGYRYCGVTRQDFAAGTVRAQEARKLLGDLPEEVIAGRSRAALAPEILREGALFRPRDPSRKILSRHSQAGAEEGPKENDSGT